MNKRICDIIWPNEPAHCEKCPLGFQESGTPCLRFERTPQAIHFLEDLQRQCKETIAELYKVWNKEP